MIIETMKFTEAVNYKKSHHDSDVRRFNKSWQLGMDLMRYHDHHDTCEHLRFEDIEKEDWVVIEGGEVKKIYPSQLK
jgi:hypothetical protein